MRSQGITFFGESVVLGNKDFNQVCEQLYKLSQRDYEIAKKRKNNPAILPCSLKEFLLKVMSLQVQNHQHNQTLSTEKLINTTAACIDNVINQLKIESKVGHYGRMSINIKSAKIINCDETIIYSPVDADPAVFPDDCYIHSQKKVENKLVTAMGGSPFAWKKYLEDDKWDEKLTQFYRENKITIDEKIKDLQFRSRFTTFYTQDRMVEFSLALSRNETQKFCLMMSNASTMSGGQWIIAAPSGFKFNGYVEKVLQESSIISRAITHYDDTNHYPSSFFSAKKETQEIIANFKPSAQSTKNLKRRSLPGTNSRLHDAKTVTSNQIISALPIDESVQFPMQEKGNFVFLLGTLLEPRFILFQNARNTASQPHQWHSYLLDLKKILFDGLSSHQIPLLSAKSLRNIFLDQASTLCIDKLNWQATCYRLTIDVETENQLHLSIADAIKKLQDTTLSKNPNCTFTYIAVKNNKQEFYLCFRKVEVPNRNPLPNSVADKYQLPLPLNGGLEIAGVNTIQDPKKFQQFLDMYETNQAAAQQIFLAMQNEMLQQLCPDKQWIDEFESDMQHIFADCCLQFKSVKRFI